VNPVPASSTSFVCNGVAVQVGPHAHLLAALRDELQLVAAKDGCSPSGQCGCCTVLIDGKARVACQVPLDKAAGREVTTPEGLSAGEREQYAAAFGATGALQCGFCTPGIVMRVKALLARHGSDLNRDQAARHLGAHLCRCTGYLKILDAVELLAQGGEGIAGTRVEVGGGIGSNADRYQSTRLILGDKDYVDDMSVPGMLHGAVRLADHARADVVSIDTTRAEAVPGVTRVITAADVPGQLRIGIIERDWPVFIPEGGRTSYLGDVMALVVADERETARHAATLVDIDYEVLRPITDAETAIGDEDAVWGLDGNMLSVSTYRRGDADGALASSAHVVRERFRTQRVEQAFLEPESTLAVPVAATGDTPRGLRVYSGGQGVWDDRDQIASVCDIDESRVWVEQVANGGAFGGKEDCSNQAQTALAAWLIDRPVKTTFSREESLLVHAKRHPIRIDLEVGCDEEGRLTALRARMLGDSGPYASVGMKVLERAAGHACGPYAIPDVDVEAVAVRTNNPVCGAFRGFGANQAQFAMDGAMDRLGEALGLSGWEIRSRNVVEPGSVWGPGQIMDDGCLGARQCLDAVKAAYDSARAEGKAVGLGLGLKNSGLGNGFLEISRAVVRFQPDDTVEVRHCWTEMGQGVHTVARQVAVEELGVDPGRVRVLVDTSRELGAGQTTGSRGTLMGAGAVAAACREAIAGGCEIGVDYQGEYRVDWTDKIEDGLDHPVIHSTFSYAAQVVIADPDTGDIERVIAAHDVGRAVNPLMCEGQVEGSVHMGLGYALTEEFPVDDSGRPRHDTLRALDIIRAKDMPPVEVILVESPQPDSPYGIKGVGEIGLVPTAGAVAAAMHEVDGRWRSRLPIRVHDPVEATAHA
jgi:aldehyde oxidoreductase